MGETTGAERSASLARHLLGDVTIALALAVVQEVRDPRRPVVIVRGAQVLKICAVSHDIFRSSITAVSSISLLANWDKIADGRS